MNEGFSNFRDIFNNGITDPVKWDVAQLQREQHVLQPIHEESLNDEYLFRMIIRGGTWWQSWRHVGMGQSEPVDILNYDDRIKYGCVLLGYSLAQGCKP